MSSRYETVLISRGAVFRAWKLAQRLAARGQDNGHLIHLIKKARGPGEEAAAQIGLKELERKRAAGIENRLKQALHALESHPTGRHRRMSVDAARRAATQLGGPTIITEERWIQLVGEPFKPLMSRREQKRVKAQAADKV